MGLGSLKKEGLKKESKQKGQGTPLEDGERESEGWGEGGGVAAENKREMP